MANTDTSTDAFLSGEGFPVDLHDVETELTRLWGPAAERAGGPVPRGPAGPCRGPARPFVLGGAEARRADEALFRDLGDECSRLILDLPDPGAAPAAVRLGLDLTVTQYGRDTAWFGLTRWREL